MEKRILAGIFLLMSATAGMLTAISYVLQAMGGSGYYSQELSERWAAYHLVMAVGALFGALFSFAGTSIGGAVLGGVMGMLASGPAWLGFVFALLALILLSQSKEEFAREQENRRIIAMMDEGPPPRY